VLQPVAMPLFLLNAAGCLLCDLKDEASDRLAGVHSVPAMFGGVATVRIAVALLLGAAALAFAEHRPGILIAAAALGSVTTVPSLIARETVGPLLVDAILTLPGFLIAARLT
jgi:4-hydroxybenzoate polyprenyltransferase